MYIAWHFENGKPQIQGIFDNEELAQKACVANFDCYHFIEMNKIYINSEDTTEICLYKNPDGTFKTRKELILEQGGFM